MKMKTAAYTIILMLAWLSGWSQSNEVRFNLLTDELKYIRDSVNAPITDLSVTSDLRWLITYGTNGFSYLGIPGKLQQRLQSISHSNEKILSACLLPDSSWVIVTDKDKVYFSHLATPVLKALEILDRQDAKVNFMRVWPDRFIIFYNNYQFLSGGIPRNLYKSLNRLIRKGKLIKDVELAGESFVILFGHKGIMGYKVPTSLEQGLYKLQQRVRTIDLIRRIPDGRWLVIYNGNKFMVL